LQRFASNLKERNFSYLCSGIRHSKSYRFDMLKFFYTVALVCRKMLRNDCGRTLSSTFDENHATLDLWKKQFSDNCNNKKRPQTKLTYSRRVSMAPNVHWKMIWWR